LQPRICKTYIDAFSPDKPLVSLYGSVVGLTLLGHSVIRNLLLPAMGVIETKIKAFIDANLAPVDSSCHGVIIIFGILFISYRLLILL
jgi:TAF6 C-terminal HEAT repeat domain